MSLLFKQRSGVIPPAQLVALQSDSMSTPSGVHVDAETALRHDAVWAAVNRIAMPIAGLPIDTVRTVGKNREVIASPQVITAPSVVIDQIDWMYQQISSLLLRGNGWGDVTEWTDMGRLPSRIEPRHPDTVKWRNVGGELQFTVNGERRLLWPLGDLWHVAAFTPAGSVIGMSPIAYHAAAIGAALAAQEFSSRFFGDGGHPTALVKSKTALTEDQAKAIKASINRAMRGSREVAVLGADLDYEQISVTPEDSQFLETMNYGVEQIARVFGLSPELLGAATSGSSVTYANREQRQQDYLVYPFGWWLGKMERALSKLLTRPRNVKFNTGALLRSDMKTRHEVYDRRLRNGTMSRNEVRALEDEAPISDGDDYGPIQPAPPDDKGGANGAA